MKQVTYAGTSFITGNDIADALLALVAALGVKGDTASVQVPALDDELQLTTVDLVIGPASEVVAVTVRSSAAELIDVEVVRTLRESVATLERPRAIALSHDTPPVWEYPDIDEA